MIFCIFVNGEAIQFKTPINSTFFEPKNLFGLEIITVYKQV